MFGRKKKVEEDRGSDVLAGSDSEQTVTNHPHDFEPTPTQIKRATRTRFIWALISSFLLLLSVIFLILVEVGNTSVGSTLNKIYFLKLDISNIIPVSVPNAVLINSIAQSLGLHDFYTVGLWNYCQGYNGQGTTSCSNTETLYWFNPVEIIQSQLLAGATSEFFLFFFFFSFSPKLIQNIKSQHKLKPTFLPSRSPRRHQLHPRPHQNRLQLDVRPLPLRHLPGLPRNFPPPPQRLHTLALSPTRPHNLSRRTPHNRSIRDRDRNVYYYAQCDYGSDGIEYSSEYWNANVCVYVDCECGEYFCLGNSNGYVLLLC